MFTKSHLDSVALANALVRLEREQTNPPPELLRQLIRFFDWNPAEILDLLVRQRQDQLEERRRWLDTPIRPYAVIRFMATVYGRKEPPEADLDGAQLEQWAGALSAELGLQVQLVLSRRRSVFFNRGEVIERSDTPLPEASTTIRGCRQPIDDLIQHITTQALSLRREPGGVQKQLHRVRHIQNSPSRGLVQ